MMKKSRLFSLFAALMMCVSLFSAVASASDSGIQPHGALCAKCFVGEYVLSRETIPSRKTIPNDSYQCKGGGTHWEITQYEKYVCNNPKCGDWYKGDKYYIEYYCQCARCDYCQCFKP